MNPKSLLVISLAFLSTSASAVPEDVPGRLVQSPLSTGHLVDTGVGLLVVLGIMLGLAWLVKRYVQVPGIGKGQVQILGGVSLGSREKAVLLSVEGRRLLVGIAPGRVQTLLVLPEGTPDESFAEQLDAVSAPAETQLSGNET